MSHKLQVSLLAAICMSAGFLIANRCDAITAPAPVDPVLASVLVSWTAPTLRADLVTPLVSSELKEYRIYFSQLSAYIAVPASANSYTFNVPSGQCFRASDGVAVTAVDTSGLESAASNVVQPATDFCSGKYRPGAPGNVKIATH